MSSDVLINRTGKSTKDGVKVPGTDLKYKKGADYLLYQPRWEWPYTCLTRKKNDGHGAEKRISQDGVVVFR